MYWFIPVIVVNVQETSRGQIISQIGQVGIAENHVSMAGHVQERIRKQIGTTGFDCCRFWALFWY